MIGNKLTKVEKGIVSYVIQYFQYTLEKGKIEHTIDLIALEDDVIEAIEDGSMDITADDKLEPVAEGVEQVEATPHNDAAKLEEKKEAEAAPTVSTNEDTEAMKAEEEKKDAPPVFTAPSPAPPPPQAADAPPVSNVAKFPGNVKIKYYSKSHAKWRWFVNIPKIAQIDKEMGHQEFLNAMAQVAFEKPKLKAGDSFEIGGHTVNVPADMKPTFSYDESDAKEVTPNDVKDILDHLLGSGYKGFEQVPVS